MSTFRELFDEDERQEVLVALTARRNSFQSRINAANRTETAINVILIDRLENKRDQLSRMIRTVCEECD